ncbi:WXG100 family type VII secretion target [Nonomuraea sp. NPDC050404]|uniref:WXG100 family type VII secretion target n=1 Tax=Nonomuraea sp. NPDC050404 TaxID=3155783 RepID=UPI0033FEDCBF
MSAYKEAYMASAAAAAGLSFAIQSRWAYYAAAALATVVSNPDDMDKAVGKWRETNASIATLNTDLDKLKTDLQDKGEWQGQASDTFAATHKTYKQSLDELGRANAGAGDAVEQHSTLAKWGLVPAGAVVTLMGVAAATRLAGNLTGPWGKAAALIFDKLVGTATLQVTKQMVKKFGIASAVVGGLMYTVMQMSESSGKAFPGAKAVPADLNTGGGLKYQFPQLEYQEGMGLTQKVDTEGMTNMPKGGGILGI